MKIVMIAEKPSVGAYIANVLGANKRCDGYFEGAVVNHIDANKTNTYSLWE